MQRGTYDGISHEKGYDMTDQTHDDDHVIERYPRLKHTEQPVSYSSWTRDHRINYLTEQYDRLEIAAAIRREIGILNRLSKQRLTHREIAAISLDLGIQL